MWIVLTFVLLQGAQSEVDELVRKLIAGDPKAEEALVDLGTAALPALEKAATGESEAPIDRVVKAIKDFEAGLETYDTTDAAELTRRLDDRSARLQRRIAKASGRTAHVAAVVDQEHGLKLKGADAYVLATYSFEFETRDDAKRTLNDWDFLLAAKRLRVRTVTDDRSEIWDLGETDFDKPKTDRLAEGKPLEWPARKGSLYLIRTDDSNSHFWTKLQILEQRAGQWILFRWERVEPAGDLLKLERRPDRLMKSGAIRIQIRAGHGGGLPVQLYPDGGCTGFVEERADRPIDMDREADQHERNKAFVEGGLIPVGKTWILRSARIKAAIHVQGNFEASAKGVTLASLKRGGDRTSLDETWKGRIAFRPGEERQLWAVVAFFSKCDVSFSGSLWDEKYADADPELKGADKEKAEALVKALEGDDRDRAAKELAEWGPPVYGHLNALDLSKKSPDVQARVRDLIRKIGGE
jgi:hypothetical protein